MPDNNDAINGSAIVGSIIGIVALGTVAIATAPVAVPAIAVGASAVGLGALSATAISFGFIGSSAIVGGIVGGFTGHFAEPFVFDAFNKDELRQYGDGKEADDLGPEDPYDYEVSLSRNFWNNSATPAPVIAPAPAPNKAAPALASAPAPNKAAPAPAPAPAPAQVVSTPTPVAAPNKAAPAPASAPAPVIAPASAAANVSAAASAAAIVSAPANAPAPAPAIAPAAATAPETPAPASASNADDEKREKIEKLFGELKSDDPIKKLKIMALICEFRERSVEKILEDENLKDEDKISKIKEIFSTTLFFYKSVRGRSAFLLKDDENKLDFQTTSEAIKNKIVEKSDLFVVPDQTLIYEEMTEANQFERAYLFKGIIEAILDDKSIKENYEKINVIKKFVAQHKERNGIYSDVQKDKDTEKISHDPQKLVDKVFKDKISHDPRNMIANVLESPNISKEIKRITSVLAKKYIKKFRDNPEESKIKIEKEDFTPPEYSWVEFFSLACLNPKQGGNKRII